MTPARSKLDETGNLLALYLHQLGKSETPRAYQFWACLAGVAACVADRVFIAKFRDAKLTPNLYTFFVGPSGLGKGRAIDEIMKKLDPLPRVGIYRGKTSAPFLIDHLGRPKKAGEAANVFLVTPELSMSVGSGPLADALVKHMTELYTGGDYLFKEGTRTRGAVSFKNPVVNWLAGSTQSWLKDSITQDAIEGGFFARTVCVQSDYDFDTRYPDPIYPPDVDEVAAHVAARFKALTFVDGLVTLSPEAKTIEATWYYNRKAPDDLRLAPIWRRTHDMILKVSAILCLCEPDVDLVITSEHLQKAQELVRKVQESAPILLAMAQVTPETATMARVEEMMRRHGRIPHSILLKNTGVTKDRLREAIDTLISRKQLTVMSTPTGGQLYVWRKRTVGLSSVEEDITSDNGGPPASG